MPCSTCTDAARCDRAGLCQNFHQPTDTRTCTCHPDDNPPKPCPRMFALTECRAARGVLASRPARCPQCKREGFLHSTWCPVGMGADDVKGTVNQQEKNHG